ncbi:hypothetical protein QAD02_016868 [Eretmocerus hayati]|uniref:Uncharacterized protein n=1 Tax=Eretmocerus hayati TaxID=131215 RepID=A0ACC2PC89_9HYME|nr:hypothetical protein QAD02_016868 [Eretmocerus hayati]
MSAVIAMTVFAFLQGQITIGATLPTIATTIDVCLVLALGFDGIGDPITQLDKERISQHEYRGKNEYLDVVLSHAINTQANDDSKKALNTENQNSPIPLQVTLTTEIGGENCNKNIPSKEGKDSFLVVEYIDPVERIRELSATTITSAVIAMTVFAFHQGFDGIADLITKLNKERISQNYGLVDYSELESNILSSIREGKPSKGKGEASTPLIRRLLEASLEGEIET